MNNRGVLVVFSGPSGVGKGTLLAHVLKNCPDTVCSVSATTRPPRPGEVDGVSYHFISREHFEQNIAKGEMLEYAIYNGNYYGTPKSYVDRCLEEGKNVILEIEVQGARKVRKACPLSVSVFIMPPDYQCLLHRLRGRGTEDDKTVDARMASALEELRCAGEYDYIIVNQDLDKAVLQLQSVLEAVRCSVKFQKAFVEEVLRNA